MRHEIRRDLWLLAWPAALAMVVHHLFRLNAVTIQEFGPSARSTLGIGFGIETMFYCLYWGAGSAVASLVGRYLDAGRKKPSRKLAALGLNLAMVSRSPRSFSPPAPNS